MEERSGFGYFLLGLGIGVAAGILWAPRSGEETRALLADKAGEGAEFLKNRAQDGTEYVRQRTGDVRTLRQGPPSCGSASGNLECGRRSWQTGLSRRYGRCADRS